MEQLEKSENMKIKTIKNPDLESSNPNTFYYLIILNTPLNKNLIGELLKLSPYIICGDGGANRFYDVLETKETRIKFLPHQITGDFDSIKPEIKQYYEALGIKCQHDPCQDSTDLNKSMKLLFEKIEENSKNKNNYEHKIVITGCLGSRFDHNLCNLSSLLKYTIMLEENKFVKKFSIQIIHDHSIITCIMPGKTNYIRSNFFEKCEDVGLFPLTGPCKRIETKGLKWNLGGDYSYLVFGEFVSSSNKMIDDIVEIDVSEPIFMITSLQNNLACLVP